MFTELGIESFKCLGTFRRKLGGLTLLTGHNAAGKSSVVQSLAVLRQTAQESEWSQSLLLNGTSVTLGTMFDVIDRGVGGQGFAIDLATKEWRILWETRSKERTTDLVAPISRIEFRSGRHTIDWSVEDPKRSALQRLMPDVLSRVDPDLFQAIQFKVGSIAHIGAERLGPRDVYAAQTPLVYPEVGTQGEKTPWCLEQFADSSINPSLALPGVPEFVRLTVQAWMAQMFPGFQMEIRRVDAANLVSMGIRTSPGGDFFRPSNVGFGLTHVLPIVTACVSALPGRLLLIENPETHLHPAGQSQIGHFLAVAAAAGLQLVVETHSDHVLNGVRRAVRDGKMPFEEIQIYFFRSEAGEANAMRSAIDPVAIDAKGQLAGWPHGFFDQMEADLDYIFRE
jgi:predicted ATPase